MILSWTKTSVVFLAIICMFLFVFYFKFYLVCASRSVWLLVGAPKLYWVMCRCSTNMVQGRKEGNVLFNDTLNTFYLRLYGIGNMVKDHSGSERGNPRDRLLFLISSKGSFICIIPDRIIHTTAFVTPVVEHWLEREIAQWVHPMKE